MTGSEVDITFWIEVLLLILHSTQQNIIFQYYCCNYLLKMGCMDKEQAVFEQITLSDLKNSSSTALKTFSNYTIIRTNNSYKISKLWVWCFDLCCLFWVNSTGYSDEFHVVFKHFQNLENLDVEHFEGKNFISLTL